MSRSASETPRRSEAGSPRPPDVLDLYLREDDEDSRSLRISLVVAAVFHLVLLLVTLPAMSGPVIPEAEKPQVIQLAPTPRWKRPPPPKPPELREDVREVPMPDDTPDEDEPIRLEDPDPVPVPKTRDPLVLDIPDGPPIQEPDGPIAVGGEVERPERVHYVDPVYPEIARRVRHQGPVILEAVIAKDGTVKDLKVLKSLPFLLTESALDAVKQWRYSVSTLNGKPVEVKMTVTVIFKLS